jgi:hypothetical protein
MRGGLCGAAAVLCVLLFAFPVCGEEKVLFVNGEPPLLALPAVAEGERVLVPLEEFGLQIGVEAAFGAGTEGITLRWSDGRGDFLASRFPLLGGERYADLDWLVSLVGGTVHRIGDAIYVETHVPSLIDFESTENHVVLRFSGFAPDELVADAENLLHLRFHHSRLSVSPRSVVFAVGPMAQVDLISRTPNACDLVVTLREAGPLEVRRFEAPGFYSVSIRIGADAIRETVTQIGTGLALHETETVLSAGQARINFLYVERWRNLYRLRPTPCVSDVGGVATLERMGRTYAATAAIGAGSYVGLLVVDGLPVGVGSGGGDGLSIDLFGRLTFFETNVSLALRVEGTTIPIDDVNRPITYGEVVGYSPGYGGQIARGVPGSFVVVKLREDRVVSIYEGAFVLADPTAVLIVASGEAKARLSLVALGDRAAFECANELKEEAIVSAVSLRSILIRDGRNVDASGGEDLDAPTAWNVLGTDWHGGLILLSLPRGAGSAGATREDVMAFLGGLAVPVRDAVALEGDRGSSLLYHDANSYHVLGNGEHIAVALCLVPID